MNYNRINIIAGWLVFAIATIVYLLTIEPTASFWDAGEFIASAYKLEVGHPPGAPFFMLIARFFAIFGGAENAALSVNIMSAFCSSFTILFLFWSISHLAKKLAERDGEFTNGKLIAVIGSAAVGGLAYTFSDSFWFSAVEGEVYAMSSLFTAVVFWAILRWETLADQKGEWRWIILIAYMMGLSIGVHLLNLLAIPAIAFVYYFKRYEVSRKGLIITGIVSILILGFVQSVVIPMTVKSAAFFELTFVNKMGLPFNTGVIVYAVLVISSITFLLWYSRKKNYQLLNTSVLSITMILVGYSTFAMIVIRSNANPPMDENNPEHLFTLLSYLNREQYGDRPLLFGQYFSTPTEMSEPYVDGSPTYVKSYSVKKLDKKREVLVKSFKNEFEAAEYTSSLGKEHFVSEEYIESGEKKGAVPNYMDEYSGVLPRMYSAQANHIAEYKSWSDYKEWNTPRGRKTVESLEAKRTDYEDKLQQYAYFAENHEDPTVRGQARDEYLKTERLLMNVHDKLTPSFSENMKFFMRYQVGWMYWRYFMWNFTGKQNDIQGHGDILDGNWLSGVSFVDEERLGNRDRLPKSQTNNKAFNKFYFLPLLLGIFGFIFQLFRTPKDFVVVSLLFLLTGLAIVVYLNQYPLQPRERDYAYSGSFYAFSFWIGLGVYALFYIANQLKQKDFIKVFGVALVGAAMLYLMEMFAGENHNFSYAIIFMVVLGAAVSGFLQAIGLFVKKDTVQASICLLIAFVVPGIMLAEGWDDHNRAKRKTAVDFAKNYLDSLEPNAILFTNGDNDTFPLWYAQEVEGYRTDVRIVNLSLLNTDWYIDQMKRKAYDSDPVPFGMEEQMYRQGTRDIVLLDHSRNKKDIFIDLGMAMDVCLDDTKKTTVGDGKEYSYFPTRKFSLAVDSALVISNGTVRLQDTARMVDAVTWEINRSYLLKSNVMILDLLRNNNWERPVYFAVTTGPDAYMGMEDYFQLEGLAYRLVPIKQEKSRNPNITGGIAADIMYDNVMNDFQWGNMEDTTGAGVYMDENNRRMTTNFRLQLSNLAEQLELEGQNEKALDILYKSLEVMPEKNVPYDRVMLPTIEMLYQLGDSIAAGKLAERLFEINEDEVEYWLTLEPQFALSVDGEYQIKMTVNSRLEQVVNFFDPTSDLAKELRGRLEDLSKKFDDKQELMRNRKRGSPADM